MEELIALFLSIVDPKRETPRESNLIGVIPYSFFFRILNTLIQHYLTPIRV